jgi:heme a synthase
MIVALLIFLIDRSSYREHVATIPVNLGLLSACIVVLLVQVLFGTQVREAIDRAAVIAARESWIQAIGGSLIIHRSFSWVVLLLHLALVFNLRKTTALKTFPIALILLILGTILTGAGMAYFAVPAFLQPLHLLLATVSFGMQFLLLLRLKRRAKTVATI